MIHRAYHISSCFNFLPQRNRISENYFLINWLPKKIIDKYVKRSLDKLYIKVLPIDKRRVLRWPVTL